MVLAVLLALPAAALAQEAPVTDISAPAPTIHSDKEDYPPGGTVILTGGNWQPGETVNILVNDDEGQTWSRNVDVTADDNGNVRDEFQLPNWFIATYYVTATGDSGTAKTTFSDSKINFRADLIQNQELLVRYEVYSSSNCTGTVTKKETKKGQGSSVFGDTGEVPTGGSVKLYASNRTVHTPTTSAPQETFDKWTQQGSTAPFPHQTQNNVTGFTNPNGTGHWICIAGGPPGVETTYVANYRVVNQAPTISLPGGALSYTENDAPKIIDSNATVSDPDSANFDTGKLTVDYSAGGTADDRLAIRHQGTGSGEIGVSGSNVTYGSSTNVIGTFTDGSGTTPLVVTFNANATLAAVQALARNITYASVSDDPSPSATARTVRFVVTDGDGGTSQPATKQINGTPVNDPPTLTATANNPTFTENGLAVDLFGGVSVSTVEAIQSIDRLTLTASNVSGGADEILRVDGTDVALTNDNSVTTATNGMTVTVNISGGTATVTIGKTAGISAANTQALVDGLAYRHAGDAPAAGNRAVTLTSIRDTGGTANGGADTTTLSVTSAVTITAVNDVPVNTVPGARNTDEDIVLTFSGASLISTSDVDAGNADVRVTLGVTNGTLTLSRTTDLTFTAGGNGQDSMTFTGTLAAVNAALDGLRFDPNTNYNGPAQLTITTNDQGNTGSGGDKSDIDTVDITVTAVNDRPIADPDGPYDAIEDTTLNVPAANGVLAGDTDSENATLVADLVTAPARGTLTLNTDGSFQYVPAPNDNGSVNFTYRACEQGSDPAICSDPRTVTINVAARNDAPAVTFTDENGDPAGTTQTVDEGQTRLYTYTIIDVDGGPNRTVTPNCGTGGTQVASESGDPANSFRCAFPDGPATPDVSITVNDGSGSDNEGSDSITVTVNNVRPTVTLDGPATVNESTTAQRLYTFTVTDLGDDTFTVDTPAYPTCGANGTLVPGSLTTNATGGSFECIFRDGGPASDPTTTEVAIQVKDSDDAYDTDDQPVKVVTRVDNAAPTATFEAPASVNEGQSINLSLKDPVDPAGNNDTLEYRFKCGNADWTAWGTSTTAGCPTTDDGEMFVQSQVRDGDGGQSNYDKTVTVNDVAPNVTAPNGQSVEEGNLNTFDLGSFTDPGADGPWTITVVWGDGDIETFTVDDPGQIPATDHEYADDGNYEVRVTVAEAGPGTTPSGDTTFTVTVSNVRPVARDGSVTTPEEKSKLITLAATDPGADPLEFRITSMPAGGKLHRGDSTDPADEITAASAASPFVLTGNKVTYVPNNEYEGSPSFDFVANDGAEDSLPAKVTITVTPANDRPAAGKGSANVNEDGPNVPVKLGSLVSDTETTDENLTYNIVSGPTPAQGVLTGTGPNFTFDPAANFAGKVVIRYTVTDRGDPDNCTAPAPCTAPKTSQERTFTITVDAVNDKPVARNDARAMREDTVLRFPASGLLVNDSAGPREDGQRLTVTAVGSPVNGTVRLVNGGVVFTPDPNYNGPASFAYTVCDNGTPRQCATAKANITVTPVNAQMQANDDQAVSMNDKPMRMSLIRNDVGVDGALNPASVTITKQPRHGSVKVTRKGVATYTPDPGFSGTDSFVYRVCDRDSPPACDTAVVRVTVHQPDPPEPPRADLTTDVESPAQVELGSKFSYTVTVGNKGPDKAENVVMRALLPESITFVSAPANCKYSGRDRTLTCSLDDMADGATRMTRVAVRADKVGTYNLVASAISETQDPNRTNSRMGSVEAGARSSSTSQPAAEVQVVPSSEG